MTIKIEMHFCATETPDGLIHVQNFVMGLRGQHHVHSKEGFERWAKGIKKENLHYSEGTCDCGMKSGDVEEYNGHRWHNDRFEVDTLREKVIKALREELGRQPTEDEIETSLHSVDENMG